MYMCICIAIVQSDHPLQDILHTDACDSSERAAFNCFTITTPIRANQVMVTQLLLRVHVKCRVLLCMAIIAFHIAHLHMYSCTCILMGSFCM